MSPKQILERHEKYPEATEHLIEAYAFGQYQKAVKDLTEMLGSTIEVPSSDTVLIALTKIRFDQWKEFIYSNYKLNFLNHG